MSQIILKPHYCIICRKSEICIKEKCSFVDALYAHGECYANLPHTEKKVHGDIITNGLRDDQKESERKAIRDCYNKEYRKQWKEKNFRYHNEYRKKNPDTIKKITKKYSSSDKGKIVRKRYAEKTKSQRTEYQKTYMREYRKRQRENKQFKNTVNSVSVGNTPDKLVFSSNISEEEKN